ncbi:Crp/Fnr family transcriptional regulator [Rhodocyclus tenuis]|uniref:Crp/Fnr family transcriptional regulator n=1 Tax=Rhodocyclus tenuis TaxID=1066 RepID=UPI001905003C|nr:Crp/Fnr family transcriptional regulator [Rhodocyclus tenuis]
MHALPHLSAAHPSAATPLPPALLERFARQRLARGHLLSTPGAAHNRILYLQEGRIRVFVASEDKELTLAYLSAGELFSTHTRAYLRCESACTLLSMPTGEFARSMANEPGMLGLVMPVLGRILDNSIALIEDLAFRDVAGRLARFMLVSARQQGVALAPGMRFTLDLAASEIALLLGCTRQTVSSLFKRMERAEIITRSARRQFVVLQPERLLRWQEGDATEERVESVG